MLKTPRFSDNIVCVVCEGQTVTYTCIQLAVHMGFTKIYLLGVDHTSSRVIKDNTLVKGDASKDYFKGVDTEGVTKRPYEIDYVESAFMEAKIFAHNREVSIINVTRGGQLDIFERMDFDIVFPEVS